MLLANSTCTKESEANYVLKYSITEEDDETGEAAGYGIRCSLYVLEKLVDSNEVNGITTKKHRIEKFLQILKKNQVFPVHLKDVIEDLLIMEFEEKKELSFT